MTDPVDDPASTTGTLSRWFLGLALCLNLLLVTALPHQTPGHPGSATGFGSSGSKQFGYRERSTGAIEQRRIEVRFYVQAFGWPFPLVTQECRTPFQASTQRTPPGGLARPVQPVEAIAEVDAALAFVAQPPGPGWDRFSASSIGSGFAGNQRAQLAALPTPRVIHVRGLLGISICVVLLGISVVWQRRLLASTSSSTRQLAFKTATYALWPAVLLTLPALVIWDVTGGTPPDLLLVPPRLALVGTIYLACAGAVGVGLLRANQRGGSHDPAAPVYEEPAP